MKNNDKSSKGSITKPLLADLSPSTTSNPSSAAGKVEKPSFGRSNEKRADLAHDAGGRYNQDLS